MKKILLAAISALLLAAVPAVCTAQVDTKWKIHDPDRPAPPVIDPGTPSTQDSHGRPPSDAAVLFDGKDLSKWAHKDGTAAKWKVENGYAEVVAKTGYIYTREAFGDCQTAAFSCKGSTRRKSWTPTKARLTRTARPRRFMANTLR